MSENNYRIIDSKLHELKGICDTSRCDAWCCRHMLFKAKKVNIDDDEYFRFHDCEIIERGDNLFVFVPKDCGLLDKHSLRCKGYSNRPRVCMRYAMQSTDLFKSEHCGLRWVPVHGRKAQVIMSKMRKGDL